MGLEPLGPVVAKSTLRWGGRSTRGMDWAEERIVGGSGGRMVSIARERGTVSRLCSPAKRTRGIGTCTAVCVVMITGVLSGRYPPPLESIQQVARPSVSYEAADRLHGFAEPWPAQPNCSTQGRGTTFSIGVL